MIVFIGHCDQVVLKNGDVITIRPPVPLGICPERGLVTAPTRAALATGRTLEAPALGPWEACKSVDYIRDRDGQRTWYHDVNRTEAHFGANGPVFRTHGMPAFVCPSPPGDFICGG